MTAVRAYEQNVLAESEAVLGIAGSESERRLEVLEAASCAYSGIDVTEYWAAFCAESRVRTGTEEQAVREHAARLLKSLASSPAAVVPVPLALASLARVELSHGERRNTGAYYTDFRLAGYLAEGLAEHIGPGMRVIDPAAGSGLLLTALALSVGEHGKVSVTDFVANAVCAADVSAFALRGARLALAAVTDDLKAVMSLDERLLHGDSLLTEDAVWEQVSLGGFDVVIGNPPWEKLKVTRHEVLANAGVVRHYGADYATHDDLPQAMSEARQRMLDYLERTADGARLQGRGEADLYKLFLEFSCRRLRAGGRLALLVPAGLIRSQGTEPLRRFLLESASELEFTVVENRARFFAIDTRFKFLALKAQLAGGGTASPVVLKHASGTDTGLRQTSVVTVERSELAEVRRDLTVPEVRGPAEWEMFLRMSRAGVPFDAPDGTWRPQLAREVDMSRDRADFRTAPSAGYLPVIEGRMVHQYRSRAKAHRSGTGRAAQWDVLAPAEAVVGPQFWHPVDRLRRGMAERTRQVRAGFCDVTGQTNERTLLTAVIPPDTVCGNKVPTVVFDTPAGSEEDLVHLWVALMNSIPVDWLARRITTTSMNYFLLLSIPLPPLVPANPVGARIIELSRQLTDLEGQSRPHLSADDAARTRAEIDVLAARAYGLGPDDLRLMFEDFALLDRGQTALDGEKRSTITRDLVLAQAYSGAAAKPWADRVTEAQRLGATAYVPADYAHFYN
ncbi:restriction endonuclease [Kitasatospora sp. CB02891]|uniref:Eco57I restriction-modification methylase domain-containing protein n=1 Tax=Kitasatospora sp. CB02891 TaxID=2020329 RepID=UPI000C278A94|nr:restriction endonuclease [Kitasatospora sp. CB02891]PJN22391.1 restriction endonuclease [Kitasatospora sp. CB02891]